MRIQHNIAALNSYRNLTTNNNAVSKNLEKLSSGYRINRAGDDAAGLAISEKMRAQITGLNTAQKNANDGISLVQTAEGALTEVHSMLNRMVELANQSANGTYANAVDRENLQEEINSLTEEIDRISQSTNFNGINLLDGTLGLNGDTFTNITQTAAIKAGEKDISDAVAVDATTHANAVGVKDPMNPEFKVDFADLKITLSNNATTSTDVNIKLTVGDLGIKFYDSQASANAGDVEAKEIKVSADAKADAADPAKTTEVTATTIADKFNGKIAVIGSDSYTVSVEDNRILKFTYTGQIKDKTLIDKDDAGGKPTNATMEKLLAGNVAVEIEAKASVTESDRSGHVDCHVTGIKDPVADAGINRAGATLNMEDLVDDIRKGASLKIGKTTITFNFDDQAASDGSVTQTDNESGEVKLKGFEDAKDKDLLKEITRQLSHMNAVVEKKVNGEDKDFTFTIGRGADEMSIEIEEQVQDDSKNYGKFTEAELKNEVFSLATAASNAKSSVTIGANNASDGDKIKIGDKTYKFVKEKAADNTDKTVVEVEIGKSAKETAENLKNAVGGTAEVDGSKVTFTSAKATDDPIAIGSTGLTLQVGDTSDTFNQLNVKVDSMSADSLGIGTDDINISTQSGAQLAVDKIKAAINTVSSQRGKLGAIQNRLEHTINNLSVTAENITAAESRIRDVDMAEEMMAYTKNNILVQASQAMLAQANQIPQGVLQLLQ